MAKFDLKAFGSLRAGLARVPRGVVVLGMVSLMMDFSSEMIHALLPLYLVGPLAATALTVGLIEGIAEATAAVTKVFSGAISDRIGRRKPLVLLGYGLAALTKPVFPLAPSAGYVVAARFVDRIGKGLRGAPRDALIADLTPAGARGAAYGLRQSLDTVGAVLGPLVAIVLMALYADFKLVFWVAVIPAIIAVLLILVGVSDPDGTAKKADGPQLTPARLKALPATYWVTLGIASVLMLARFSEAFLVLAAHHAGLVVALAPLVLVVMNIVYSITSALTGGLADAVSRRGLLALGIAVLAAGQFALAATGSLAAVALGIILWGVHMGLTQGLLMAVVADAVPVTMRGTAFGLFHLVTGSAILAASLIAGLLWDRIGPMATFLAGGGFALLTLVLLVITRLPGAEAPAKT